MSLQQQEIECDGEEFTHSSLCTYIPASTGSDQLSGSLLDFKSGRPTHVKAWIDCSVSELKRVLPVDRVTVVRALQSSETVVTQGANTSLDQLGRQLAHALNGSYHPELLTKNRLTQPMKRLASKSIRKKELQNVYQFHVPDHFISSILVIDDILTSGATIGAIIRAIRAELSEVPVHLFALACTGYYAALNDPVTLKGDAYEWETEIGWMNVAEPSAYYDIPLDRLMTNILNDSFGT